MELTADDINRWFKLGVSATDMTYGQLSIGASLAPLNNMGTDVQQPFDTPEGFVVTSVKDDTTTGFRMVTYANSATHEILVVPNGSDGFTAKDWSSNGLYVGYNQWEQNKVDVINNLRAMVNADKDHAIINIVGHSLGGALAQYTLVELLQERQKPTYTVINDDGVAIEVDNPLYNFPLDRISLETFASPGVMDELLSKDPDLDLKALGIDDVATRHYTVTGELVNQIGGAMVGGDGKVYYLDGNGSTDIGYTHRLPNGFYDGYLGINGDIASIESKIRVTLSTANLLAIGTAVATIGGDNSINSTEGLVRLGTALVVGSALDMSGEVISLVRAVGTPYIGDGLASIAGVGIEVAMKALLITNPIVWAEMVIGGVIGANLLHIGTETPTADDLAEKGFTALRDGYTRSYMTLDDGHGGTLQLVTDQAQGIIDYQVKQADGTMWHSEVSTTGEKMEMMDPANPANVQCEVIWRVDKPYAQVTYNGVNVGNVYPDQLQNITVNGQDMTILLRHANTTTELRYSTQGSGTGAIGIYVNGQAAEYNAALKVFSYQDGDYTVKYTSWQDGVDITDLICEDDSSLLQTAPFLYDVSRSLYIKSTRDINKNVVSDEEKSVSIDKNGNYSIKTTTRTFNNLTLTERIEKSYTEEILAGGTTYSHQTETVYFTNKPDVFITTDTIGSDTTQTVAMNINNNKVLLTYKSTDGSTPKLIDVKINDKVPTDADAALVKIACSDLTPDDFKKATTLKNEFLLDAVKDYADTSTTVWQDFINGVTETTQAIEKYAPWIIDTLALIRAMQTGELLPTVSSSLHLINDLTYQNYAILNGASNAVSDILSIISLNEALKSGNGWAIATSGVNVIYFSATAYASFAKASDITIGLTLAKDIHGYLGGALLTLRVAAAIASGDETSFAITVVSLLPEMGWVGLAYSVYNLLESIFSADVSNPWGTGEFVWDGTNVTFQSTGETGGNEAVSGLMSDILAALNSMIATQNSSSALQLGIIANRMPSIGYDTSGFYFTDIDPLTGQEKYPTLRYDVDGKPYNAAVGSPESFVFLGEAIMSSALYRDAVAPMWEVKTAKIQTDVGMRNAGLSEEERAAKDGKLATVLTGDTQIFRPVVLDINGDGIHTIDKATSGVSFDVDNSGFFKETAWISNQDAFLTLDRNFNGVIDNGQEMFSNSSVALDRRGLAGMEWIDANNDGKITSADPVWEALKIWQDANGDGQEETSESFSLTELGISELNYTQGTFTQNGIIKEMSSEDLSADTEGIAVNIIPGGILATTSKGENSLIVNNNNIDDLSMIQAGLDHIWGYEDTELVTHEAGLLANDALNVTGDQELTLTQVSNAQHGTVSLDVNGFVHFIPEANYAGDDAGFDYTTTDSVGQAGIGSVKITLLNIDDVPTTIVEHDQRPIYAYQYTSGILEGKYYDYPASITYTPLQGSEITIVAQPVYEPYTITTSSYQTINGQITFIESSILHDTPVTYEDTGSGHIVASDIDDSHISLTYEVIGKPQYGEVILDEEGHYNYISWSSPGVISSTKMFQLDSNDLFSPETDAFQVKVMDPSGSYSIVTVTVPHIGSYTPATPTSSGIEKPIYMNDAIGDHLIGDVGNDILNGSGGCDLISGGLGDDILNGNDGNDIILGGIGNDVLNGGVGMDIMSGGLGNDTYVVGNDAYIFIDTVEDVVIEYADEGVDTVQSYVTYRLGMNLENLTLLDTGLILQNNTTIGTDGINGYGNNLDNTIIGNKDNNILDGGAGDDILMGGEGTNTLDGGDGNDTAFYSGIRNSFDIRRNDDGTYSVDGETMHDTLSSIESIRFDEGVMSASYALEVRETQEVLARYYDAFFDRIPDEEGLAFWANYLVDSAYGGGGNTMGGVAQLFYWFSEYDTLDASVDNGQFVTLLYNNILDRAPDQAGYDYWVAELNQTGNRAGVIASFADSEELAIKTDESIDVFLAGVSLEGYILI